MSKFTANVELSDGENAGELIRAFFRDFNPESSIAVKGKDAKLEIVFDKPPLQIIDAISYCKVINLNYGKSLIDYKEETATNESHKQAKQTVLGSKNFDKTSRTSSNKDETLKATEQPKTERVKSTKLVRGKESINIPELEKIAKEATSFEDFTNLVAQWLEMGKRQKFFESLVIASTEVNKVSWKELEDMLQKKGIVYTEWDKIFSGKQVSKKLRESSVTILPFLKAIRQYKSYSFKQITEEAVHDNKQRVEDFDNNDPKPRVKMECMPEIRSFEETLASVDKTQPIEERVRYVLKDIGIDRELPMKQQWIVQIASIAIKKEKIDLQAVLHDMNIPTTYASEARMTFSTLLNNFVSKYESDKKVKLSTFLSELQKIIILDGEIETS